ncbi:MFS transporter [Frankia sp. CNm7]|uniref:MFS transporter n=1 Tax=Frankia nepalensis TaxID=1836974 RepID=A0A937R921_9ACTN|nr:MFS transporter [Frankia nepalensis]MBL7498130.1 MFS transporter [Frankia nepalensis]MBL7509352.1 MFS transporter [Frankia nepalensis]MBL7516860.1 MFS transporter [Frankia nepalensis]MBL7627918.1 MFS transporter [Frankia nepalensis]
MTELSERPVGRPTRAAARSPEAGTRSRMSPGRARLELLVVGFAALMVSMSQGLLVPVLPILPAELNTSHTNAEWLLTSTLLVAAVAVPLLGRLGDMFGKRLMLLVALAALAVGSLICALTDNVGLMITGRALQGVSTAAIPLGISLLMSLLPRERVGSAIALISAMLGVGAALSLPLAGVIGEHADFHVLFWITCVGGVVAFAGMLALVPEGPGRGGGRVDLVGTALLSAGLVALLLPLAETANWGWGSARVLGLLALAVVLLTTLVVVERRIREPLVDIATLRRRPLVLTNLASLLFGFALFASMIGTASYVQAPEATGYGFGSSMIVGGLALLPSGLCMLVLAPVSARLVTILGAGRTLALGAVIVAAGWGMRIVFTGSLWQIILGTTIVGVGTGVGYAAMPSLINAFTPPTEIAAANGMNTLFRAIGSSLASAIGGSILVAQTMSVGSAELPSLTGYRELFALCAGAGIAAAVAALAIPRGRRSAPEATA